MKTLFTMILMLFIGFSAQGQFLKKLKKRAEKAAEEAVIRKTEEKVGKETEKAMDTILNGKGGEKQNPPVGGQNPNPGTNPNSTPGEAPDNEVSEAPNQPQRAWTKYNFVPGDEILFADDLGDEENGEFPSRWDLLKGNAENAVMGGENVIQMDVTTIITPLIDGDDYLPEVFTIEFDAYFNPKHPTWQYFAIRLFKGSGSYYTLQDRDLVYPIKVYHNGASVSTRIGDSREYKGFDETRKDMNGWRHIALAFNKRSLKVFVDEYRALNIPNLQMDPHHFSVGAHLHRPEGRTIAVKNFRIAKGGKDLYDRLIEDGKFVTRGILFDVAKTSIKPESFGIINEVAKMMNKHTDLKFEIIGHTDSDGDEQYNQRLSEGRAQAVKEALVNLGISNDRIKATGRGESIPVADNSTPEGKANNRRVEFIKQGGGF